MNNEPVAWINKTYYPNGLFEEDLVWSKVDENSIPLYTHPVKEQDTECQYCKQGCIRCDARKQLTDDEILDTFDPHFDADIEDKELIKFARAILRKASKK